MPDRLAVYRKFGALVLAFAAVVSLAAPAAQAQELESIDPDTAIDGDLADDRYAQPDIAPPAANPGAAYEPPVRPPAEAARQPAPAAATPVAQAASAAAAEPSTTYAEDDLIGAAEGVFGKGAEGLARLIEDLLREQGEPNAYIVGREGGGAVVVGVRYGSGTLFHKVEGQKPVYWTGPSLGFDLGANAGNTFVLVYNLFDTEELYERYPAGEGQAYLVGGFNASYMRKGDVVLIPIRVGAGLRLGVNAGYMRFSKKQRWVPF